jgi:hypothetical protein
MKKLDFPIYPKAFVAAARLTRERDRVFVAMPFESSHSENLWRTILGVCQIHGLNPRRADLSVSPKPIVGDILEELERAEIIIADLTDLNPNVLYELGIAHVRCDSVILIAKIGQSLPFDLASIRCIFFDLSSREDTIKFAEHLGKTLESFKRSSPPIIIESSIERTNVIVNDIQLLSTLFDDELTKETVWYSGFLSAFAISKDEYFAPEENELHNALLNEKESLKELAHRGCKMKCIITPPKPIDYHYEKVNVLCSRLQYLINYLESNDRALDNIEWVISPFRQKNMYIIGRISCIEGYKRGIERGYGVSLRQTSLDAIESNISLYETLFDRCVSFTLGEFYKEGSAIRSTEALRKATINCINISYDFYKDKRNNSKEN